MNSHLLQTYEEALMAYFKVMIPELACRQGEKHKLQTGKAGLLSEN
jgi:hypothetical protein